MNQEYVLAAMAKASYALLANNEGHFGTIPGFDGLWSEGETLEECQSDLRSKLEGWLQVSAEHGMPIPEVLPNA